MWDNGSAAWRCDIAPAEGDGQAGNWEEEGQGEMHMVNQG